jgi:hypothetical protein
MIVFIIPLKSPKASKSWELTCAFFERTLRSICGQTCSDFHVVVVCNEKPIINFHTPFVEYIEVDLPVPSAEWLMREKDKAQKLAIGLERSKHLSPSHVMVVDADDLISNKIAEFVKRNSEQTGWHFNKGYIHEYTNNYLYYLRKEFGEYCGSSVIIKPDLFHYLFIDFGNKDSVETNFYDHTCKCLPAHKIVLNNIPFCGAIYSRTNGDNIFAVDAFYTKLVPKFDFFANVKHLTRFRLITSKTRKEFGFYEI